MSAGSMWALSRCWRLLQTGASSCSSPVAIRATLIALASAGDGEVVAESAAAKTAAYLRHDLTVTCSALKLIYLAAMLLAGAPTRNGPRREAAARGLLTSGEVKLLESGKLDRHRREMMFRAP